MSSFIDDRALSSGGEEPDTSVIFSDNEGLGSQDNSHSDSGDTQLFDPSTFVIPDPGSSLTESELNVSFLTSSSETWPSASFQNASPARPSPPDTIFQRAGRKPQDKSASVASSSGKFSSSLLTSIS
jgi:hypothetical protein